MKRKYTKKFAKNPSQENLINKNNWRNTATKLRRRAIKEYWKTKTDSSGSNPRDFFKVFKPFLDSKARGTDDNVINLDFNDSIIQDQTKVANCLVHYFTTVANDIGDPHLLSLTEEELKDHKSVQKIRKVATTNGVQFKFRNFNVKEVTRALETLNPNKSIGHDKIPPRMLTMACNVLAPSLTNIFNVCIQTSNWPEQWKRGIWVPLHKKDNHSDIKNYRPITILAAVDKVFEQLLSNQVTQFMEPHLSNCLTAYRKQNSCETIKLMEDWKEALDSSNVVGILLTDLSKAFDSLHPPLLLAKLKAYGFEDFALGLMKTYFSERWNRVRIGTDSMSDWRKTERGSPQGSNFGPLM